MGEDKNRTDWYTVEERELIGKIRAAAAEETIPAKILPEMMKEKLKSIKQKKNYRRFCFYGAAAATLLLFAGGIGIWQGLKGNPIEDKGQGFAENKPVQEQSSDKEAEGQIIAHKKNVGEAYQLASDYGEVWEKLAVSVSNIEGAASSSSGVMPGDTISNAGVDSDGSFDINSSNVLAEPEEETAKSFSTTNLQTENVDESDIVKTDGNYIYQIYENQVVIIDIRGDEMTKTADISPELKETANIRELYLDGNQLCLIITEYESTLEENAMEEELTANSAMNAADCIWIPSGIYITKILTYDITDRSNPVLMGTYAQDGNYLTSRKVGKYIYLFSEDYVDAAINNMQYYDEYNYTSVKEEAEENYKWIPQINGKQLETGDIYLAERDYAWYNRTCELLISSMDLNCPDQTVDQLMVVDQTPEVYVGNESIYLYHAMDSHTDIAKFSYKDGILNGESSVSVDGYVRDTFAVSEKNGKLRIITTGYNNLGESYNQLYLLNESLEITGKIPEIAPGEEIYAARYIGDMAYFITYRNTDPLFAADISDESNPVLLGSLEVTGFSEYLHPYGEGLMFGLGYETDPESGNRKGMKISMFDVSDPTNPKVLAGTVLDADYSTALYQYKAILIDYEKNFIGFSVTDNSSSEVKSDYKLYQWTGSGFEELASVPLSPEAENLWEIENYTRGIYADDRVYISAYKQIISLDGNLGYQKVGSISIP